MEVGSLRPALELATNETIDQAISGLPIYNQPVSESSFEDTACFLCDTLTCKVLHFDHEFDPNEIQGIKCERC